MSNATGGINRTSGVNNGGGNDWVGAARDYLLDIPNQSSAQQDPYSLWIILSFLGGRKQKTMVVEQNSNVNI